MDKLKNIYCLISTIVIIILLSLKQCDSPKTSYTKGDDIVYHHTDTIYSEKSVIKFQDRWYPKEVKSEVIKYQVDTNLCRVERTYSDSLSDSNLTIYTTNRVLGLLEQSSMQYRLKIPLIINNSTTTIKQAFKPNKYSIGICGGIGGNDSQFLINAGINIRIKRELLQYDYEFINKTHNLKVGIILFNSNR